MTTTLTLEVEEDVLARAEAAARDRGGDLRAELLSRVNELSQEKRASQIEAMQRFVALAKGHPVRWDGELPNREERNAR